MLAAILPVAMSQKTQLSLRALTWSNETQDQRPRARCNLATQPKRGWQTRKTSVAGLLAVRWIAWLGLGFVANRFDVVPVRTDDEGGVVVRVVLRAQAGRTVVFAARLEGRAIESFDLPAILGRERQVKMRRLLRGLEQDQ